METKAAQTQISLQFFSFDMFTLGFLMFFEEFGHFGQNFSQPSRAILGLFGAILGPLGAILGPSWVHLGAKMRSKSKNVDFA